MICVVASQAEALRPWFQSEEPGPIVGKHVLNTGHGQIAVDRRPSPRALVATCAGNYWFAGDPSAVTIDELRAAVKGFVEGDSAFQPMLEEAFAGSAQWHRTSYHLNAPPAATSTKTRLLNAEDSAAIAEISGDLRWIWATWGGPECLASSGRAWGVFANGQPVSIACSFFVGDLKEEVGVVTESSFRNHGLARACAARLCQDIFARGHTASWVCDSRNIASRRTAEAIGFQVDGEQLLLAVGTELPKY